MYHTSTPEPLARSTLFRRPSFWRPGPKRYSSYGQLFQFIMLHGEREIDTPAPPIYNENEVTKGTDTDRA